MKTSSKNSTWAAVLAGLLFALVTVAQIASAQPTLDETVDATLIDPPTDGTFWLLSGITGDSLPPYPFNPYGADAPVYLLTSGELLVDDSAILISTDSFTTMSAPEFPPDDGGGGGSTNDPPPAADLRRNYEKFAAQTFSLLDTNEVCASDTNLCNAINSFPNDTNTYPTLQIKLYHGNSVIIRANHFDYSAETRDFALLISDKVETALWKSIDMLGSSDAQDGWLVQGSVPQYEVTDPMYMLVSLREKSPTNLRVRITHPLR